MLKLDDKAKECIFLGYKHEELGYKLWDPVARKLIKKIEWVKAMQEEMKSLNEKHTYDSVKLPKRKRALKNKWVYKLKIKNDSQ